MGTKRSKKLKRKKKEQKKLNNILLPVYYNHRCTLIFSKSDIIWLPLHILSLNVTV